MKKISILLVFSTFLWTFGIAQDVYYTRNATLTLHGVLKGNPISVNTKALNVTLDYETAFLTIRFPVYSLKSNIDSLDNLLERNLSEIIFEGKLGMEYVNTEDHPPIRFSTEGWLIIGDSKTLIKGKGELHHVGNATEYACMLGMTMLLSFRDLDLSPTMKGISDDFEAVITQALLQQGKN